VPHRTGTHRTGTHRSGRRHTGAELAGRHGSGRQGTRRHEPGLGRRGRHCPARGALGAESSRTPLPGCDRARAERPVDEWSARVNRPWSRLAGREVSWGLSRVSVWTTGPARPVRPRLERLLRTGKVRHGPERRRSRRWLRVRLAGERAGVLAGVTARGRPWERPRVRSGRGAEHVRTARLGTTLVGTHRRHVPVRGADVREAAGRRGLRPSDRERPLVRSLARCGLPARHGADASRRTTGTSRRSTGKGRVTGEERAWTRGRDAPAARAWWAAVAWRASRASRAASPAAEASRAAAEASRGGIARPVRAPLPRDPRVHISHAPANIRPGRTSPPGLPGPPPGLAALASPALRRTPGAGLPMPAPPPRKLSHDNDRKHPGDR
jgi:hypothetical protein